MASAERHWSAAKEQYAAGDYLKAMQNLDPLLDGPAEYRAKALPFSLVLTAGAASGYLDMADYYTSGAHVNKAHAAVLHRKASDYRALANHMVLQFAENVGKMETLGSRSVQLAFGPLKGTAAEPALFRQISDGMELVSTDEDTALALAVDRGVLLAVCAAAGQPNNPTRTTEMLQRGSAIVNRATFMKAMADMLMQDAKLYGRNSLDDPSKMAKLRQVAQDATKEVPGSSTAMVLPASN